jgi:hypothetical protein
MVQVTMLLPDQLAARVKPIHQWLPVVLELSLLGLRTSAVATATEIIEFLSTEPTSQAVLNYHVSERAQMRLRQLLAMNEAGLLSEEEQHELDELERLEHLLIMFKLQLAGQINQAN